MEMGRFRLVKKLGAALLISVLIDGVTRGGPPGPEKLDIRTYDCNHIPQKELWGEYRMYSCLIMSTIYGGDQISIRLKDLPRPLSATNYGIRVDCDYNSRKEFGEYPIASCVTVINND